MKRMTKYPVELINGEVRIQLEHIGEGLSGDYNESDPEDIPLLRFYVDRWNDAIQDWEPVDDASYCTRLPTSISDEECEKALKILMDNFKDPVESRDSVKKLGEELSWIDLDWLVTEDKTNG